MNRDLLGVWYRRAEACHKSHFLASHRYSRYNYLIGVPTILLTTAVGTSIFASLSVTTRSVEATVATGFVSMAAAILSSLQTFLGFAERADRHRDAGVKYGTVGRNMELLINEDVMPTGPEAARLKRELDDLAASSPKIPLDILKSFGTLYADASLDFHVAGEPTAKERDNGGGE